MTNRKKLADAGYERAVVFDKPDYDNALIGVTVDGQAVYDLDAMREHLVNEHSMASEEAEEFIWYNTLGALPTLKESAPIVITLLEGGESGCD